MRNNEEKERQYTVHVHNERTDWIIVDKEWF